MGAGLGTWAPPDAVGMDGVTQREGRGGGKMGRKRVWLSLRSPISPGLDTQGRRRGQRDGTKPSGAIRRSHRWGNRKQTQQRSGLGRPGRERAEWEARSWRERRQQALTASPWTWPCIRRGQLPTHGHWNLLETSVPSAQHSLSEGRPYTHTHTEQNFVLRSCCPLSGSA